MKRLISLLLITMFSVVLVSADGVDDQGNPNDPAVNERANACFDGGDMEGKCDTEWEWICGWHVIRLDAQDEASRVVFPPGCVSLLPEYIEYVAPISTPSVPNGVGCIVYYDLGVIPISVDFVGGYYVHAPFWDGYDDCGISYTGGYLISPSNMVYAPAPFDALTLCNLNGAFSYVDPFFTDVWFCQT